MFCQTGKTQSLLQLLVLLGKKNGGSRTIAILHTTYRLTMRLVSAPISQWDVKFAGTWDSTLMEKSGWAFAQCRYGERHHHRFCQEGQVSADQRERKCSCLHVRCTFLFVEPSTNLACLRMDLFPIIFLCALGPEGCGHKEERIVGMSRQQPDQSHTHEGFRAPGDIGPGTLGH